MNAADAFTIAQVAIGLLRQQLPPTVRVHGVMTNGRGAQRHPARTEGRWYVRAESLAQLAETEERVWRCFEAGALATGATLTVEPEQAVRRVPHLRARAGVVPAQRRGARPVFDDHSPARRMNRAPTDMGNVSRVVDAIHPYIGINSGRPSTTSRSSPRTASVGTPKAILDAATALAWTALDVAGEATAR